MPLRRQLPLALMLLGAVLALALYLELLGWRILHPGITLRHAWGADFLLGGARTAGGAVATGLAPVALALLHRRSKAWIAPRLVIVWGVGAALFLAAIAALVAWAP